MELDARVIIALGAVFAAAAAYYVYARESKPAGPPMPTRKQVDLVTTTWGTVRGGEGGLDPVGVAFFTTLFTQQPAAIGMFRKFRDEADYKKSAAFRAHAAAVIGTVDTAFGMLRDLPALVPVLQALGKAHAKYGVKPSHYNWIGAALLTTLSQGLGDAFTPEVEQAYATVWGVVAATMIDENYAV
ncbi:hypothetical protein KFE25_000968 [Diacronema lutheri]|uniref:Globin domain-containing protein n=2 Tax=Diacronema lutheri TaxID=2081491 RepID=A0A8J5XAC6_DIALT|nr:hypothetical protein KFE25_000968 [Diacronema lutheri]